MANEFSDWPLVGFLCACAWGVYIVVRGFKTGVVTASINHRKRIFHRGDRYFTAVLVMHSLLVVVGLCMGGWLILSRFA